MKTWIIVLSAVVGLIVHWIVQWQVNKYKVDSEHREKKIIIYQNFLELMEGMLLKYIEESEENITEDDEFKGKYFKIMVDLQLWASSGVIKSIHALLEEANKEDPSSKQNLIKFDAILKNMRKDLKLSNFGLKEVEVFSLILKGGYSATKKELLNK